MIVLHRTLEDGSEGEPCDSWIVGLTVHTSSDRSSTILRYASPRHQIIHAVVTKLEAEISSIPGMRKTENQLGGDENEGKKEIGRPGARERRKRGENLTNQARALLSICLATRVYQELQT